MIGNENDVVTILIVDDDQVDVRAITRALRRECIDNPIEAVGNGQEALELLRGENGKAPLSWPYIILLDLNMPRMNGLEFLEVIRNDPALSSSIVFILSTSNEDRDKTAAYKKNVAGYIVKSSVGKDFMNLVSMLEKFVITVRFPKEKVMNVA